MPILGAFIVPHPPLIIPEVGRGQERGIQRTIDAYEKIGQKIAAIGPETIVVISPHSVMYGDYIHISPGGGAKGGFGKFGASGVSLEKKYDEAFVGALSEEAKRAKIPAGTLGERDRSLDHGVLVPLYFVERYFKVYQLVRISISGLSLLEHYNFGKCIAKASDALGRKTVIVASGDLSHKLKADGPYGFASEGPEFDKEAADAMESGDFMRFLDFDEEFCEKAAECGLRSFVEMAGALDGRAVETEFLSYEGPFGVGYAVCGFSPGEADERRRFGRRYEEKRQKRLAAVKSAEDEYVRLARLSLETYVREKKPIRCPEGLPNDMLHKRAGVFVSLKKDGRLRGCIGTIAPTEPSVADEIVRNAVSAGAKDPRFEPVGEEELPLLVYSVDVLGEPEPIASAKELDVKRYGVIVAKDARRGLLLPDLEGVDTPEQQISIALQKAGISPNERYSMERFCVVRHK